MGGEGGPRTQMEGALLVSDPSRASLGAVAW